MGKPNASADPAELVADQLRGALIASGVSATALAAETGVDRGTVRAFLDGKVGITLATAARLGGAVGMRVMFAGRPKQRR